MPLIHIVDAQTPQRFARLQNGDIVLPRHSFLVPRPCFLLPARGETENSTLQLALQFLINLGKHTFIQLVLLDR